MKHQDHYRMPLKVNHMMTGSWLTFHNLRTDLFEQLLKKSSECKVNAFLFHA